MEYVYALLLALVCWVVRVPTTWSKPILNIRRKFSVPLFVKFLVGPAATEWKWFGTVVVAAAAHSYCIT